MRFFSLLLTLIMLACGRTAPSLDVADAAPVAVAPAAAPQALGHEPGAVPPVPGSNMWVEDSVIFANQPVTGDTRKYFVDFDSTWNVPATDPPHTSGSVQFLFNGVQGPASAPAYLLQPVLQWNQWGGCGLTTPYVWSINMYMVDSSNTIVACGTATRVYNSDEIEGSGYAVSDSTCNTTGNCIWNGLVQDNTTGGYVALNPGRIAAKMDTMVPGVFENRGTPLTTCSQLMPSYNAGGEFFHDVLVYMPAPPPAVYPTEVSVNDGTNVAWDSSHTMPQDPTESPSGCGYNVGWTPATHKAKLYWHQ